MIVVLYARLETKMLKGSERKKSLSLALALCFSFSFTSLRVAILLEALTLSLFE